MESSYTKYSLESKWRDCDFKYCRPCIRSLHYCIFLVYNRCHHLTVYCLPNTSIARNSSMIITNAKMSDDGPNECVSNRISTILFKFVYTHIDLRNRSL